MEGYISIREIADNILEHPMLLDLNFERIVNHAIHFIRKVGSPNSFIEKVEHIDIDDYKGLLPCDYYLMILVKMGHHMFRYTTDSFHLEKPILHPHEHHVAHHHKEHLHEEDCCHPHHPHCHEFTYKILGNVIFTSMPHGHITISYLAVPLDEEGYPLIKENSPFIEALQAYIKERLFTILFDLGKINGLIMENARRDYAWAVGLALADLIMPTLDEMESITNMWNTLVPRMTDHSRGMKYLGTKEYIRRH